MSRWRVVLLYNPKHHISVDLNEPPDALVEYDLVETVQAIEDALLAGGHEVIPLEADRTLLDTIPRANPDICFNVAEADWGNTQAPQVSALLEMLGIPYVGSKVLAHALSLDKAATRHIWRDLGLPTAPCQVFCCGDEPLHPQLTFPLLVKPVHESRGMRIEGHTLVHDETELREQVCRAIRSYRQPALVEAYLPGREFTVGLIGNTLTSGMRRWNGLYDKRGFHFFPVLEIDPTVGVGQEVSNAEAKSYYSDEEGAPRYFCPADILPALETKLKRLTVAAFEAIGALDVARVDFRLGADGQLYLLEINTFPSLNPRVSNLCIMARAEEMHYTDLINEILNLAVERYGLSDPDAGGRGVETPPVTRNK